MSAYLEYGRGVSEWASGSNPRIEGYFTATDYQKNTGVKPTQATPWCAAFVNWNLQAGGVNGNRSAWAPDMASYGDALTQGVFGAIVFVKGDWYPDGHTAFFVYSDDTYNYILGGNQSNSVNISKVPIAGHDWTYRYPSGN